VTAERVALVLQGTVLGINSSKGIVERSARWRRGKSRTD
jgi:hypothetical protein